MNVFLFSVAQTVSNNNVSSFQNMHFEISGQMQCNEMRGIWNVNSSKNGTMRKFYNIQQFLFQINWKSVCLKNDCVKIKSNHFESDRSQMENRTTVWMKYYKFVGKYWCWFKWIHHLAHSQRMRHTIATCATAFVVNCDAGHLNSSTLATANCTDNKSLIMKYIYKRHKYAMHFPVWMLRSSNKCINSLELAKAVPTNKSMNKSNGFIIFENIEWMNHKSAAKIRTISYEEQEIGRKNNQLLAFEEENEKKRFQKKRW